MGFPAKYSGICLRCRKDVLRGQTVTWSRVKGQKGVYHENCDLASDPPPKAEPIPQGGRKYKVGDRIRIISSLCHGAPVGSVGAISAFWSSDSYLVAIDSWHGGHGDTNNEQYINEDELELVKTIQVKKQEIITTPNEDGIESVLEEKSMSQTPQTPQVTEVSEALRVLMAAMAPKEKPAIDAELVRQIVKEAITESGTLVIEVRQPSKPSVTIDLAHKSLPDLLYYTGKRKHTYLHGPHGGGKSTGAHHAATALGLKYGYISLTPQTPESRLVGYMNATGGYVRTPFRDCYELGGVFCIDELDNSSPALVTTLNGALENGHMAFPDCLVPRHEDFVMVGTGNTSGRGANPSYPDRRPFDSAFGDRFIYIMWEYDEKLERKIATGINKDAGVWVTWVQQVRKWAAKNHPRFTPSPRCTFRLAEFTLDNTVSQENMLDGVLWRGDAELRNKVLSNCPLPV